MVACFLEWPRVPPGRTKVRPNGSQSFGHPYWEHIRAYSGVFGRRTGRGRRSHAGAAGGSSGPRPNSHQVRGRIHTVASAPSAASVRQSIIQSFSGIFILMSGSIEGGGAYSGVFGRIRSVCGARVTRRGRTGRWCAEYGRRACAALAHSPTATECLWAAMCTARTQTSILCAIHTSPYISFGWR